MMRFDVLVSLIFWLAVVGLIWLAATSYAESNMMRDIAEAALAENEQLREDLANLIRERCPAVVGEAAAFDARFSHVR